MFFLREIEACLTFPKQAFNLVRELWWLSSAVAIVPVVISELKHVEKIT